MSLTFFSIDMFAFGVTWVFQLVAGIKVEEKHIPVFKPAGEIPIRIYTPDPGTPEETFPVLIDLHGMSLSSKSFHSRKTFFFIQEARIV